MHYNRSQGKTPILQALISIYEELFITNDNDLWASSRLLNSYDFSYFIHDSLDSICDFSYSMCLLDPITYNLIQNTNYIYDNGYMRQKW